MEQTKLIDIKAHPIPNILNVLLKDRTTKRNIIWATDSYSCYGKKYQSEKEIKSNILLNCSVDLISPRVTRSLSEQKARTKKKAEVFTPAWLCKEMNDYLDKDFYKKTDDWQKYIKTKVLEITCGEAPFLVSRYDTSTGESITDLDKRIGLLDRKLKALSENISDKKEWLKWSKIAYQNVYGYEYQGDNLLIARINLLLTFIDYYKDKFNEEPNLKDIKSIAYIISWNIWQMDGLKNTVPFIEKINYEQLSLFGERTTNQTKECQINLYRKGKFAFKELQGENIMKFDYILGNPPYQQGKQQIYADFYISSIKIANCVELIFPVGWQEPKIANGLSKLNKKQIRPSGFGPVLFLKN